MAGVEATVAPGAVPEWARAMDELWSDRKLRQARGEQALARARERFGAERFYSGLMSIYAARAGA